MSSWKLALATTALTLLVAFPGKYALSHGDLTPKSEKKSQIELKIFKTKAEELQQQNQNLKKQLEAKLKQKALVDAREAARRVELASLTNPANFGNCDIYRPLVASYGWPVEQAMRIMSLESGCRPNARSATADSGLFQINDVHLARARGQSMYSPEVNVRVAHDIWAEQGWCPWTTARIAGYC